MKLYIYIQKFDILKIELIPVSILVLFWKNRII